MLVCQHLPEVRTDVLVELAIVVEPPERMPREDNHSGASAPEPIEYSNGRLVIDGVAPILTVAFQERKMTEAHHGFACFPFLEIDQDESLIVRYQGVEFLPPDAQGSGSTPVPLLDEPENLRH